MTTDALTLEEAKRGVVERLATELDPRTNEKHRDFFDELKPEAANAVGEFHAGWARRTLRVAMALRDLYQTAKDEKRAVWDDSNSWLSDNEATAAREIIASVGEWSDQPGFVEIRPLLERLRAFADQGLMIQLWDQMAEVAEQLATEPVFFDNELEKVIDLARKVQEARV